MQSVQNVGAGCLGARLRNGVGAVLLTAALAATAGQGHAQSLGTGTAPPKITISSATPGSDPNPGSSSGTITMSTGLIGQYRIRAWLSEAVATPDTLTLVVSSAASGQGTSPTGGTPIVLTTTSTVVWHEIPALIVDATLSVAYTLWVKSTTEPTTVDRSSIINYSIESY